jgi:hypothetical protein
MAGQTEAVRDHRFVRRDVLRYEVGGRPAVGEDEAPLRVVAAAVNPVDGAEFAPHRWPEAQAWSGSGNARGKIVTQVGRP